MEITQLIFEMIHFFCYWYYCVYLFTFPTFILQIILGWAGDRSWANASIIYAICMCLCGGVIALVPLISDYYILCLISGAFGFLIAANYSLTCVILVELITLDRFTNAYGLLLLVQGFANLIGPPLGGNCQDCYQCSYYDRRMKVNE